MPRIFDNIELPLLPALQETLDVADRADFCVGYLNLRGWRALDAHVDRWPGGDEQCCRVLVGMLCQSAPHRPSSCRAARNAYRDVERGVVK